MIDDLILELGCEDRPPVLVPAGSSAEDSPADVTRFPLCRKQSTFGHVNIPQYWMDQRLVYGDQNRSRVLHGSLVRKFWELVCADDSDIDDDTCQSLILADLQPDARSKGSRRVLIDSIPSRGAASGDAMRDIRQELENSLMASDRSLTPLKFSRSTADAIGPPPYSREVWERYREFELKLMEESVPLVRSRGTDGLAESRDIWADWKTQLGRRSGQAGQKLILDILSYEARAALHRCYSACGVDS